MSDFTEQEFNEAMLRIQPEIELLRTTGLRTEVRKMTEHGYTCFNWNPYNDLNQLMPIAWKQRVIFLYAMYEGSFGDYLDKIRQCLWQIAQEQK